MWILRTIALLLSEKRGRNIVFPGVKTAEKWLDPDVGATYSAELSASFGEFKNPEIPILEDYGGTGNSEFWASFPKRELSDSATTRVNTELLDYHIRKTQDKMTFSELRRAEKVLKDLREGADSYQRKELPPINVKNSASAVENGAMLTDTIAT